MIGRAPYACLMLLLLAGCAAARPLPSRQEAADGCFDYEPCIRGCTSGPADTRAQDCALHQRDAYQRKRGLGPYAKEPPRSTSPASSVAEAPEGGVIVASETPLGTVALAARSRPAIVAVRAAGRLGTGFGLNGLGWIATNYHVVRGADRITVSGVDGRERPVLDIVAFDAARDLAILRVEAPYPALTLATRAAPFVGEPVLAIGNPFGLESTVSSGIVSGLRARDGVEVLQISAPISPGSSGGPVLDQYGAVLGVSTFTFTKGQNLNFAVHARYLRELLRAPRPVSLADFAAASRPEAPPSDRPAPPGHLQMVRVTPGAEIRLVREDDGGNKIEKLVPEIAWATSPFVLDVPVGERWTLVAQAPGYADLRVEILFARGVTDMTLRIELTRKPAAGP